MARHTNRDERQELCVRRWIDGGCHGTVVASTGFGKTRVALNVVRQLQVKRPDAAVTVVVPTTTLQEQWGDELSKAGCLNGNVNVAVINTAAKRPSECDLLILDEAHRYPANTFSAVFEKVSYKMILCLTATMERLDGKHVLIQRYAPVVDRITVEECLANRWVAPYKEYAVLLDVDDLDEYDRLSHRMTEHFEFFDYDFSLVMSMLGPQGWKRRNAYARQICSDVTQLAITAQTIARHAAGVLRAVQARKKYIYDHPEKLRVAETIIAARPDRKIITFSNSVATAEKFSEGKVYTGKDSKKSNRTTLEEFNKLKAGVLHTCKLGEEGLDIPGLSVGIMLGVNSSRTKHTQTRGRVIRYQEGKHAEFFTLLLNNTVELEWWRKSNGSDSCEVIDEDNLMRVLDGKPYETVTDQLQRFTSRW